MFNFLTLFNFFEFSRNYPAISEILGSIQRTGYGKLVCLGDCAQNFLTSKVMARKILIFLAVLLKVLDFSRELLS